MKIYINSHEVIDYQIKAELDKILELLHTILKGEQKIMVDLTALTTQVQANTDVEASAVILIQGIAAELAKAGVDPVALKALTDKLNTSAQALAAAVVANTPPPAPAPPTT